MQCSRCGLIIPPTAIQCDCRDELPGPLGGGPPATTLLGGAQLHQDAPSCGAALAVGPPQALGLPLATFGERLLGHLVDSAFTVGGLMLGSYVGASLGVGSAPAVVLFLGYLFLSDGLGEGQSFGKKLVKIAVVDQRTGRPCTFGRSVLRNMLRMFGLLDCVFALGDRRQRLGDKAAQTVVVRLPG